MGSGNPVKVGAVIESFKHCGGQKWEKGNGRRAIF